MNTFFGAVLDNSCASSHVYQVMASSDVTVGLSAIDIKET